MSIENTPVSYVQQFRPNMKTLVIKNNVIDVKWSKKLSINEIFCEENVDDAFKLTSLFVTLDLICRFSKLCEDMSSVREIWVPHLSLINALQVIFLFYFIIYSISFISLNML